MSLPYPALLGLVFLTLLSSAPASPAEDLARKLENTQWMWRNSEDLVNVAGQKVLKDGAWTEVRFRPKGQCSAWHHDEIIYEGKWEVIGPASIRITPRNAVGLVLNFQNGFQNFIVANETTSTGTLKARLPWPAAAVGRWRWPNGRIVTVREDGKTFSPGGDGRWKMLAGDRFEINWRGGGFIDTIRIMSGNNKLKCKNQVGKEWQAERAVEG